MGKSRMKHNFIYSPVYGYLSSPENRAENASRKLVEIAKALDYVKSSSQHPYSDVKIAIGAVLYNIRQSRSYLHQYQLLTNMQQEKPVTELIGELNQYKELGMVEQKSVSQLISEKSNDHRVTIEDIRQLLDEADIQRHTFWGKELVTSYRLRNGFTITTHACAVNPANFDLEIGCRVCRENAEEELWKYLGFTLQDKLYEQRTVVPQYSEDDGL